MCVANLRLIAVHCFAGIMLAACDQSPPPPPSSPTQDASRETRETPQRKTFVFDGPMPVTYQQAPMLAQRVADGSLPPVAQRLPENPLVIPPVERIGEYGGTWRRAFTGPADKQNADRLQHDHVIYYDLDGFTVVPHIAESWEVLEDGKAIVFQLRRGMKWSDGHPFTADDFIFAHQDVILSEELNPVTPSWVRIGNGYGTVRKLDDYTVRYEFPQSYHAFPEIYAGLEVAGLSTRGWNATSPYAPAHYLKQFHAKFANGDKLNSEVEEAGLDNWVQLFKLRCSAHDNPALPVVGPWKMVQPITGQRYVLERNPYYWAVDPEGNQLPYIDRIVMYLAENLEVLNLRAIAGEIDMQHRHIQLAKYPVFKQNAERGDYRLMLWPAMGGSECVVFINQTYEEDPEVAQWLRNRDFRIALSLGIDREEINETIFLGTGTPRAFICSPETPFYPGPEYEKQYAMRDAAQANAILDRIGLKEKNTDGMRLGADGKSELTLRLSVINAAFLDYPGVAELLVRHWHELGLRIDARLQERSLFTKLNESNKQQMLLWEAGGSEGIWYYPSFTIPTGFAYIGPAGGQWYQSRGKIGIEPNERFKRLLDLYEKGLQVPRTERVAYGQEIFKIHADNLFAIGTVGLSPAFNGVVVIKNNFRNVPDIAPNSSPLQNPGIARTCSAARSSIL